MKSAINVLRVGVIGAGANTKLHHIPKLQAIDGVEVVAVANRSRESAAAVAKEFGIPKVVDSWREIIQDDSLNAVVIGTWPFMHRTLTLAALHAGKHVLCEARMVRGTNEKAMNGQEAREMLTASQERPDLVAQIVPSPLSLHYDSTIQHIIKQGGLGDLVYIQVRGLPGSTFPERNAAQPLTWRQNVDLSGNNVMMMGIYYECLQRWVGDPSSVQALGSTAVPLRSDPETGEPRSVQISDHLDILATYPGGATAHFLISSVLGGHEELKSGFALYGTLGTLRLDLQHNKLFLALKADGGTFEEVRIDAEKSGGWRVEEEFVNAIRGKEKIRRTDFTTGVRYMAFTDAVAESRRAGQRVPVAYA